MGTLGKRIVYAGVIALLLSRGAMAWAEATSAPAAAEHQLVEFDATEAVWVVIVFVLLLLILYKTAWKNVLAGLQGREKRIRDDLAQAQAARDQAQAALKEYNQRLADAEQQVRQLLAQAATDAHRIGDQLRAQAQKEAEEARNRALVEIDQARKTAAAELYGQAATIATQIAEKILARHLNADDHRDLVQASLAQLPESMGN